jgi:hypothetical protein
MLLREEHETGVELIIINEVRGVDDINNNLNINGSYS